MQCSGYGYVASQGVGVGGVVVAVVRRAATHAGRMRGYVVVAIIVVVLEMKIILEMRR